MVDYKWLILAVTALSTAGTVAWTLRLPKVYQATASIEYDPHPARPLGSEVEDVADPSTSYWVTREFFETQNRILASRGVAERVVRRLGLNEDPTFFSRDANRSAPPRSIPATAQVLQRRLSVEPVRETRIVNIQIQDEDPERAATIANALTDTYIEKTMEDRLGSTVNALEWLAEQLDKIRGELGESELALHRFKEEHNILSVSMEDRQNIVAHDIEAYNTGLTEARSRRISLQARVERLRTANQEDPLSVNMYTITDNERTGLLRTELREKLAEREELAIRYGDAHPSMQAVDATIESLRARLRRQIDEMIEAAEQDLQEVQRVEAGLQAELDRVHSSGLDLNLRHIEYERLNRERENKAKLYELVLARATETDLTRMLRTTYVRVVDRALKPTTPISPNVASNVIGGLMGGLGLGLALAFALGRLDRRIRGVPDVEEIGLPVLGVVPTIMTAEASSRTKRRRSVANPNVLPSTGEPSDLIVHHNPTSAAAECCRTVRTNLTFMAADAPIRSVVVSSPHAREGKTTVACNLAISIAQSGKRVLLVDTDLRRPRIHKAFRVPSTTGITSVLVGAASLAEAVQTSEVPGVDLLVCGPIPPNPSELLHRESFRALLEEAIRRYDQVILDSPPLAAVTDSAVIAPQVDGVILVIKAQQTTRDAIRSALRQLRDVGAKVLGAIVNDVDLDARGYGGGYYHYYRADYYYGQQPESESPERDAGHAAE